MSSPSSDHRAPSLELAARRWCCEHMERHEAWVLGVGAGGMAGFIGSLGACGWLGVPGAIVVGAGSLAVYAGAIVVGRLGDGFELARRTAPVDHAQDAQTPSSSCTWPVSWNPNFSATSR